MFLSTRVVAQQPAESAPPVLPNPILVLTGLVFYEAGGKEWTRYQYSVANLSAYPDELFAASPDLPPCGTNTAASRTWVDFYGEDGNRLNGFCAIMNHDGLAKIWFAVATGTPPPVSVFIVLTERLTETKYRSNLAPTFKGVLGK